MVCSWVLFKVYVAIVTFFFLVAVIKYFIESGQGTRRSVLTLAFSRFCPWLLGLGCLSKNIMAVGIGRRGERFTSW